MKFPVSIFVKVTLLYLIALIGLITFFLYFSFHEKREFVREQHHRYFETMKSIHFLQRRNADRQELYNLIHEMQYESVHDSEMIRKIIQDGQVLFEQALPRNAKKLFVVEYEESKYLIVDSPFYMIVLKDNLRPPSRAIFWVVLGAVLLVTTLVFVLLIRSMRPLKDLREKIRRFSEGEAVDFRSECVDEIGAVSNELDNAIRKTKALMESRQMFMRTIMHELRTPIAKGRVSAEMLEAGKQKDRIIKSYERLDELIREFARIEEVTSSTYVPKSRHYGIRDVVEHAVDMLMLSDEERRQRLEVELQEEVTVNVDFDSFALALKNLLDNGIKYAKDKKVRLIVNRESIIVVNLGDALPESIEHYLQPFAKGSEDGLGLGLYIVKKVLDMHRLELRYRHEDQANYFEIRNLA